MNLLSLYLIDFNGLSRKDKARAWWYAAIILVPLATVILAHIWYGPSLDQVMG